MTYLYLSSKDCVEEQLVFPAVKKIWALAGHEKFKMSMNEIWMENYRDVVVNIRENWDKKMRIQRIALEVMQQNEFVYQQLYLKMSKFFLWRGRCILQLSCVPNFTCAGFAVRAAERGYVAVCFK